VTGVQTCALPICSSLFGALRGVLQLEPMTRRISARPPAAPAPASEAPPLRILLAEDNLVNQKVARLMLHKLGYTRIEVANNGVETLEWLHKADFDVVLMDVQMPELDGLEATRQLRTVLPAWRQPYVVAMTANALAGDRDECLQAGMDDYVTKPVTSELLGAALLRSTQRAAAASPVETEAAAIVANGVPPAAPVASECEPGQLAKVREMFGEDGLLELVEVMVRDAPQQLAQLRDAVASRDSKTAIRGAHTLRGMCQTIGAPAQGEAWGQLERGIGAGDWEPAPARADELIRRYEQLMSELLIAVGMT
jgi:CheY-like chemotaxis protein